MTCKCVKVALLHRACHALQSTSPSPYHPISPLLGQPSRTIQREVRLHL